ncbi:3'-5' exonuclease [Caballeronia sp. KNU42]
MKVAIIDTEPTGVAAHDEPISVGILLVEIETDSGRLIREIARYHGWREPRVAIHPKAQAVHGMTVADLAGKALDLGTITSLINEAEVLIAHSAQFDARMLSVVWAANGERRTANGERRTAGTCAAVLLKTGMLETLYASLLQ